jgi:hypothetical protein
MSPRGKIIIGGVAVGLLAYIILPWWVSALIIIAAVALPVVGYAMLDPSQRRRVRAQGRKRLGS